MLGKIGKVLVNLGNVLCQDIMTASRCHDEMEDIACRLASGDGRFLRVEAKIEETKTALETKIAAVQSDQNELSGCVNKMDGKLDTLLILTRSNGNGSSKRGSHGTPS